MDKLIYLPATEGAIRSRSEPVTFYPMDVPAHCHIPSQVLLDERLQDFDKILYGRLRGYAGKNYYCYVKIETLNRELGKSRATIYRSLKRLVGYRYFVKHRAHQRATTNYYFIVNEQTELWLMHKGLL